MGNRHSDLDFSDSGDDPPRRRRNYAVTLEEIEFHEQSLNSGKLKGRGSSVSKKVGFCPGLKCRQDRHLTTHHIIPKWVLKRALQALKEARKKPRSKGVQAIFGDMRPPLIDLCRSCHDRVEKLVPNCPEVGDEHEYYNVLRTVIGRDYERYVYMGSIFARPSQICRDAEKARRHYRDEDEIFSYQPLLSYLQSAFAVKQVRRAA